ncbi:hypothetical protein ATY41_12155 [Leifsonia xyli subsp. xyli]|uniref:Transcriptional regulator, MarR family n=2 Tax=Leifsonia xyli subsp. xyli TaxID=59736 RepID=Q6AFL9_LEIXX|nr:MarR family transcriptional regulator [Leifsonia xyli]AAT88826.1 transcriptional regulator, MarR family [Leifsonia xyli subsp. xyli str. CTCB07]ODA89850.1 hypothetical protein ATY41_12155 [Leifsonia xyli subsp. xyli]
MAEKLSPEDVSAWRGFLRWSETVVAAVAADLASRSSMSVSDFEVAARLAEADGLPQGELASSLEWSASRLSHQLKRMEQRQLIMREATGHGRALTVTLTPVGRSEFVAAAHVHAESVRAHFLDRLEDADRAVIRRGAAAGSAEATPNAGPVEGV